MFCCAGFHEASRGWLVGWLTYHIRSFVRSFFRNNRLSNLNLCAYFCYFYVCDDVITLAHFPEI